MANLYSFLSSAPSAQQGFTAGVQNMESVLKSADALNARYAKMGTDAQNLAMPIPNADPAPLAGLAMPNRALSTVTPATPEAFLPVPSLSGTAVAPEVVQVPDQATAAPAPAAPAALTTTEQSADAPVVPAATPPENTQPSALSSLTGAELRVALAPTFSQLESQYNLPAGYLDTVGAIETGGRYDPRAQNPDSTAGGLFQFLDGTARQYGLTNKYDPQASAAAAAKFAKDNASGLQSALGRAPTGAELYLAHNQGLGGARQLLANPNASALSILTRAYNGNVQQATAALTNNGGNANMTAQQFVDKINGFYKARAGNQVTSATTRPVALITPANPQGEVYATTPVARANLRKFNELNVPFKAEMAGTISSAITTGVYTDVASNVFGSIWRYMAGTDTPTATQQAELQAQASAWYQSDEANNWFNATRSVGSAERALADPMAYFLAYNNAKAMGAANVAQAQQVIDTTLSAAGDGNAQTSSGVVQQPPAGVTVNNIGRERGEQPQPQVVDGQASAPAPAQTAVAPPRANAPQADILKYTGTPIDVTAVNVDTKQVMLEREVTAVTGQTAIQKNLDAARIAVEREQNKAADLSRQAAVLMQEEADTQRMREYYRQRAVNAQNAGNVTAMESALQSMETQTASLRTIRNSMNTLRTDYEGVQTAIAEVTAGVQGANALITAATNAKLNTHDQSLYMNQGYMALGELTTTGNPARVSQVWSAATGQNVVVQPRSDGKFSIVYNGEPVMNTRGEPMAYSATQLTRQFMSSISTTLAQSYAASDAAAREATLEFQREQLKEAQKAMTDFNLEQFKQASETARVYGQYTVTKGDNGTLFITRNGLFDANQNAVVFTYDPNVLDDNGKPTLSLWQGTNLPATGGRVQ